MSRLMIDITQVFWPITSLNAWEGISILGPIAGVFGRQLEQWLISPNRKSNEEYIPVEVIERSIDDAPCALKRSWLFDTPRVKPWSKNDGEWDDDDTDSDSQLQEKKAKMQRRGHGSDRD